MGPGGITACQPPSAGDSQCSLLSVCTCSGWGARLGDRCSLVAIYPLWEVRTPDWGAVVTAHCLVSTVPLPATENRKAGVVVTVAVVEPRRGSCPRILMCPRFLQGRGQDLSWAFALAAQPPAEGHEQLWAGFEQKATFQRGEQGPLPRVSG